MKGFNFRMEGIQGAVLRVKLRHLERWTDARLRVASRYDARFAASALRGQGVMPYADHVRHLYVVRTPARSAWQQALSADGIQTGIHYPTPVHLLPAFASLGGRRGMFPHAERAADEVLSLPMYAELPLSHVEQVAAAVCRLAAEGPIEPAFAPAA
jgi:dTDP-4-amino-4,6-dideoxygalactose transaminase